MAQVEFRTGYREVPQHVADMTAGLETQRMTYEEAIAAANARLQSVHVEKLVDKLLTEHLKLHGIFEP